MSKRDAIDERKSEITKDQEEEQSVCGGQNKQEIGGGGDHRDHL